VIVSVIFYEIRRVKLAKISLVSQSLNYQIHKVICSFDNVVRLCATQ